MFRPLKTKKGTNTMLPNQAMRHHHPRDFMSPDDKVKDLAKAIKRVIKRRRLRK